MQHNLLEKAGYSRKSYGGLVWYLASNGPVWHVYGCWQQKHERQINTVVMKHLGSFDLREPVCRLDRLLEAIKRWAYDYQRLAQKLLTKAAASRCACCSGDRPSHRDEELREQARQDLERKIEDLVKAVGL